MGETLKKRRITLLKELACKAKGRHDVKLPLSEVAPLLVVDIITGGTKLIDSESEGVSDLAYDFNTLFEEGLIELIYLDCEQDGYGGVVHKNPAVTVTIKGFEAVSAASKSWLKKAIEQQPMTFLQIVVYVVSLLIMGIGGWVIGRYVTPVEHQKQVQVQQPVPDERQVIGIEK